MYEQQLQENLLPFCMFALLICFTAMGYVTHWYKKNPWHQQDDDAMCLSPREWKYRRHERQKLSQVVISSLGAIILLSILFLTINYLRFYGWHSSGTYVLLTMSCLLLAFIYLAIRRK